MSDCENSWRRLRHTPPNTKTHSHVTTLVISLDQAKITLLKRLVNESCMAVQSEFNLYPYVNLLCITPKLYLFTSPKELQFTSSCVAQFSQSVKHHLSEIGHITHRIILIEKDTGKT